MTAIFIIIQIFFITLTIVFYAQQFFRSESAKQQRNEKKKMAYFNKIDSRKWETEEDYPDFQTDNIK